MRPAPALILVLASAACAPPEPGTDAARPAPAPPSTVIAADRLGEITLADADRFILDLPPGQRWQPETEPAELYATAARRLAVDRLLHEEALLVGADQDPELKVLERRILRNAYSQHFLGQRPAAARPPSDDEARAYYQENVARFERGERREVSHVFKRFRQGAGRAPALAEIARIRERALAGESFELLAREHSDSETRHDGGRLGLVPRGRFPEDFDRVVFGLEVGAPSETLVTADGAHVFLVTNLLEARSFAFEDVRRLIAQELEGKRREQALAAAAEGLALPEESYVPGHEEVVRLLRTGEKGAVLLRLGDFRLTAGQLEAQVQELRRLLGARREGDLPLKILDEVRHREIIYQHLLRRGLPEIPRQSIEQERRRRLIDHHSRRKMASYLERHPERIQAHYERNVLRFASPLKVHVRHLAVPHRGDAHLVMARLEEARAELDAGRLGLEDLAASLGGRLRDLGLLTAARLQALDPVALRFAFQLEAGEHSPPYQLGRALAMFQVAARQEPVPRPLALVRERVVQDYLAHYSAPVFGELTGELLAAAGFELHAERLAEIGPITASGT